MSGVGNRASWAATASLSRAQSRLRSTLESTALMLLGVPAEGRAAARNAPPRSLVG